MTPRPAGDRRRSGQTREGVLRGVRSFLDGHRGCGGLFCDTAHVAATLAYRVVVACFCGETAEWTSHTWMTPDDVRGVVAQARRRAA
ncbi:MAG: hypothetical protein HYU41_07755 [Candidatus Rokubacteria bacterium]|nr:hypothetical protein [Candidatus Rokubacteria bacterium]